MASFLATAPGVSIARQCKLACMHEREASKAWRSCERNDGEGITSCDRIMAFTCIICSICGDASDLLIGANPVEKIRQYGRISNATAGHFNRPDLKRFLINLNVNLAPEAAFGTAHCPLGYCEAMHDRDVYAHPTHPRLRP